MYSGKKVHILQKIKLQKIAKACARKVCGSLCLAMLCPSLPAFCSMPDSLPAGLGCASATVAGSSNKQQHVKCHENMNLELQFNGHQACPSLSQVTGLDLQLSLSRDKPNGLIKTQISSNIVQHVCICKEKKHSTSQSCLISCDCDGPFD